MIYIKIGDEYLATFAGESEDNISQVLTTDDKNKAAKYDSVAHTYGANLLLRKTLLSHYFVEDEDGNILKVLL